MLTDTDSTEWPKTWFYKYDLGKTEHKSVPHFSGFYFNIFRTLHIFFPLNSYCLGSCSGKVWKSSWSTFVRQSIFEKLLSLICILLSTENGQKSRRRCDT